MDGSFFSSHVLSKISLTLDSQPGQQLGVEGAAAAVVAGGRPHGVMIGGVELTGHKARSQAAERSADLMAARGEPLAGHGKDAARHAGQAGGDLHIIRGVLIQTAELLGLVVPGNAEQVDGVDVPQAGMGQLFLDFLRDEIRILHLRDGRDDDVVFLGLLDVVLQAFLVDAKINHCSFLQFLRQDKNIACIWKCQNVSRSCRRIL